MKRIKNMFSRRDFMKNSAFITAAGAGAGFMVGANPELEVASAEAAETTASATVPTRRMAHSS
jgi:nitrous oxide reductase